MKANETREERTSRTQSHPAQVDRGPAEELGDVCMRCTAFKHTGGPLHRADATVGECRADRARPGGTKWAIVKGSDWCRDGFRPNYFVDPEEPPKTD